GGALLAVVRVPPPPETAPRRYVPHPRLVGSQRCVGEVGVRLGQRLAAGRRRRTADEDLPPGDVHVLATQAHHALDEVLGGVGRVDEHDQVTTRGIAHRLVDEDEIAGKERRDHRRRGNRKAFVALTNAEGNGDQDGDEEEEKDEPDGSYHSYFLPP